MSRYAVEGTVSRQLLSWGGRVLVHDSQAELEFLLAGEVRVVPCPRGIPPEQTIAIRYHPSFAAVTWPLTKEQFR